MGYKIFQNGTALTAEVMNDLIMEQAVPTFTNASERDSAVPSPNDGQHCYLISTKETYKYVAGRGWVALLGENVGGLAARATLVCTSTTRPAHAEGRIIYETDTKRVRVSNGTDWYFVGGGQPDLVSLVLNGPQSVQVPNGGGTVGAVNISVPAHQPGTLFIRFHGTWTAATNSAAFTNIYYGPAAWQDSTHTGGATQVPGASDRQHNNSVAYVPMPVNMQGYIQTSGAAGVATLTMSVDSGGSPTTIFTNNWEVWQNN